MFVEMNITLENYLLSYEQLGALRKYTRRKESFSWNRKFSNQIPYNFKVDIRSFLEGGSI